MPLRFGLVAVLRSLLRTFQIHMHRHVALGRSRLFLFRGPCGT